MQVDERPSLKGIVSTLEEAQQRVSDADLIGASRSAFTSAREAVADGWPRRRRRANRWPWVAGAIVGITVLVVLVTPACLRWSASRRASGVPGPVVGEASPAPAMPAADDIGDLADTAPEDAFGTGPLLDGGTG